jgi:hypothetical protein
MPGGRNDVEIRVSVDGKRAVAGLALVRAAAGGLEKDLSGLARGVAGLASLGGAVNMIGGAVGAVTALSGAALLVPGAALAGAAAMQTFKLATAGFGEAVGAGLTGDVEAFTKATAKMHPEMAAAARAAVAFRPQVDALKASVQGAFWDDFADGVTQLGQDYLPIMETGLTGISEQLGNTTDAAMRAATTPFFKGAVSSILQSTAGFLRESSLAAGNLLTGLVGIGQVGATYLPALGEAIGGIAKRFGDWVKSVEGQNQIKTWIDQGIAAFSDLGAIAGNIGSILGSVFTGLGGQIGNPLGRLVEFTAKLAEFAASQGAQQALTALGVAAQAAGLLMSSVLMSALSALVPVIIALAPLVTTIATVLAQWAPVLGPLVVGAYAFSQAMTLVTTVMGLYRAAMALSLAATVTTAATTVASWAAMAAGAMARAVVMAAAWVVAMGPIGWVIAAVVGLVALIIANWDKVKGATIAVWKAVSSFVVSAWNAISSSASAVWSRIVSAVTSACTAAVGAIRSFVSGAISAIAGLALLPVRVVGYFVQMVTGGRVQGEQLVNMVRSIPSRIMSIFSGAGAWLVNAGRSIIQGLWNGISSMIGWVVSNVSAALGRIRALFPFSPAKEGPFSGKGYTTYSGEALMTDFGKGMKSAASSVRGAASSALGGAASALAGSGVAGGAVTAPSATPASPSGGLEIRFELAPTA